VVETVVPSELVGMVVVGGLVVGLVVALGGQRGDQGTKRHARDPGWVRSRSGRV
jgi:hypothetical protein